MLVFLSFSASTCLSENPRVGPPFLCTAPIKVYALLLFYGFLPWNLGLLFAQDNTVATNMKLSLRIFCSINMPIIQVPSTKTVGKGF